MNLYINYLRNIALLSISILFLACFSFAQEILKDDPRIGGVITTGRQKIRIAMPKISIQNSFVGVEKGDELRDILLSDLRNSGIFWLVPQDRYSWIKPFMGTQPNFEGWLSIEAETLITGLLDLQGDKLIFEGRIFDTKTQQMRAGKRYRGNLEQVRLMAHSFANEIVRHFTGRKSFFDTQIVFVSDRTGNKEIFICDYDGSNGRQVTSLGSIALFPVLMPDKRAIIYTSFHRGFPMLYRVSNVQGSSLTPLPETKTGDITPSVSPDGKKLAFSSNRTGNPEIFVMDLETAVLARITRNYAIDTSPAWSPNGKNIVFTSDRSGMPNLYLTDQDGLEVQRLTYKLLYCDHADWSPDGERLVFAGRMRGFFNIFIKDLKSEELYQLTINSRNNEDPSWSPDGRKIVFTSDRTGQYQVYIMNSDGSDQKRITSRGNNTDPRWSK